MRSFPTQVDGFEKSSDWVTAYDDELRSLLRDRIGAQEVIVFDHTVRVDDPSADRKPARNVHNDYSQAGAEQRLTDIVGERRAEDFRAGAFGFVNVWRPPSTTKLSLRRLVFIRPQFHGHQRDWMDDLNSFIRIGSVRSSASLRTRIMSGFYLSEMTPDEVAIFNIYDNTGPPLTLPHSALDTESDAPRGRCPRKKHREPHPSALPVMAPRGQIKSIERPATFDAINAG